MAPIPRIIGMVHLGPLPGSPAFGGDPDALVAEAVADAGALADAGFEGILVENYGDAPFFADDVPKITVAAMTRAVVATAGAVDLPVGVNVLRNDAMAALAIATASGAAFIRVNVLSGLMHTDQGTISGRAPHVLRERSRLGVDVAILADVFVKHAVPPPGLSIGEAARDLAERGGADGLIVSGMATGAACDPADLAAVHKAVPDKPLYVGSGADAGSAGRLLVNAQGIIAGTAVKVDGVTTNRVDPERAAEFVAAARDGLSRGVIVEAYRFTPRQVHLVRLATGSDVYEGLTAYARDHDIRAASVTFLGAVRTASLRYYDQDAQKYLDFTIDRHLEVVAGVGNVSLLDGAPFLHIHCALADRDGHAFGGHVNVGTEVFALEATMWELDGEPPVRAPDDCTGLTLWGGTLPT